MGFFSGFEVRFLFFFPFFFDGAIQTAFRAVLICLLNVKRATGFGNIAQKPKGDVFDKLA
jgi:hypothetical protein